MPNSPDPSKTTISVRLSPVELQQLDELRRRIVARRVRAVETNAALAGFDQVLALERARSVTRSAALREAVSIALEAVPR